MEKQRNGQTIAIVALAIAIVFMSVGFAGYVQTLTINGNVQVDSNKWSVHYDTTSYTLAAGSVTIANPTITQTDVTFDAELTKPGDYASFSINVVNDGTFDATLKSITMSPLDNNQAKYLTYEITYAGQKYTESTSNLSDLIAAKTGTKTVNVKVTYVQPEKASDLPAENVTVKLSASLDYEQA